MKLKKNQPVPSLGEQELTKWSISNKDAIQILVALQGHNYFLELLMHKAGLMRRLFDKFPEAEFFLSLDCLDKEQRYVALLNALGIEP